MKQKDVDPLYDLNCVTIMILGSYDLTIQIK